MSENIGSAISGLTKFNVNTLIPSLSDNADIQEAFRIYHYGAASGNGAGQYNPSNTNPANLKNPSIAYSLYSLQDQIDNLVLGVPASVWASKGIIVTASSAGTPAALSVGATGSVLTVNPSTSTGLEWVIPEVTLINQVTLLNKTIGYTGLAFEGSTDDSYETTLNAVDPTADRTILLPNRSGTVSLSTIEFNQQTGSYTLTAADDSKMIEISSSSANTVTIPNNSSVPFPIGTQINITQTGVGQTSIDCASGVTLNCSPQAVQNYGKLRSQWSSLVLIKRDTNTWIAIGDLTA